MVPQPPPKPQVFVPPFLVVPKSIPAVASGSVLFERLPAHSQGVRALRWGAVVACAFILQVQFTWEQISIFLAFLKAQIKTRGPTEKWAARG
jgi:hypothetical protein